MILLQITMVRPGTHLVKKHESVSITSESQLKNAWSLCNQTVGTDAKILYNS